MSGASSGPSILIAISRSTETTMQATSNNAHRRHSKYRDTDTPHRGISRCTNQKAPTRGRTDHCRNFRLAVTRLQFPTPVCFSATVGHLSSYSALVTLNFEKDVDNVMSDHPVKYLSQTSVSSRGIVQTRRQSQTLDQLLYTCRVWRISGFCGYRILWGFL